MYPITRYVRTTRRSPGHTQIVFAAEYRKTVRKDEVARLKDYGHKVLTDGAGGRYILSTFGMEAEVTISIGGFGRENDEVRAEVSQSAIGSMDPETARVRGRCLLLAIERAEHALTLDADRTYDEGTVIPRGESTAKDVKGTPTMKVMVEGHTQPFFTYDLSDVTEDAHRVIPEVTA